jgi:hypothetical protein
VAPCEALACELRARATPALGMGSTDLSGHSMAMVLGGHDVGLIAGVEVANEMLGAGEGAVGNKEDEREDDMRGPT